MTPPGSHVVVLGAGALGTLIGGAIWRGGGAKVTLIARGRHAEVMRQDGIAVMEPDGRTEVLRGTGLEVVESIEMVESPVDYLILTVKSRDTSAALREAASLRGKVASAVSLQNGIEHEQRLASVFGQDRVFGGVTMEGSRLQAPGHVQHFLASTTLLGELDGSRSRRIEILSSAMRRGRLRVETVPDIRRAKWTKFVQSCASSGTCGVTRLGYAPATATDGGARLYVQLIREGAAVMRAEGLEPGDFFADVAPIREWADMLPAAAAERVREQARHLLSRGYTQSTSLLRDIEGGRPTEAESLVGAMSEVAQAQGVPAPVTQAVAWALAAVDEVAGGRPVP